MKITPKRFPLHIQILFGMLLGVIFGLLSVYFSCGDVVINWVKPWGTIFIQALKLIAVPLVLFSLASGISSMKSLGDLSQIGWRTILIYIGTTVVAVSVGLAIVNIIQPWLGFDQTLREQFISKFSDSSASKILAVEQKGPLQFIVEMIPENILQAASSNGNMLQVIVFALLFGIGLVMVDKEKAQPVVSFFEGVNEVVLKMVHIIMLFAPIGTFALLTSLIVELADGQMSTIVNLLWVMGKYGITVIVALLFLVVIVYPTLVYFVTKRSPISFFKAIAPAQALAFSSSSSAATLPLTVQCANENLKVSKEVSSFVLPLGATINMDGTSCYQAVAAVFIAQVLGYDLGLSAQLGIVLTATLASIGSAAVPGAGMVMLAIVLSHLGIPVEGIAIILGIDRLLDMCRTTVNVTGDLSVTLLVERMLKRKKEL